MLTIPTISPIHNLPGLKATDLGATMPDATRGVGGAGLVSEPAEVRSAQPGDSFANVLGRMVEEVNAKQSAASDAVSALQGGQNISLHQAMIAMEEANVSFQLMIEVRNKLLESYQEIMRMQI
jgi:flagellar hook-basal body complex protein FliE